MQIVGVSILLFACDNENNTDVSNLKNTLSFQEDSITYEFENRSSIYNLGTPFDYSYYYDTFEDKEYVYKLYVTKQKTVNIVKYLLGRQINEINSIDTFRLEKINIESTISSLYLSVTALDSIFVFKNSQADKDTVYQFYQEKLLEKSKFITENENHHFVIDYNIRYNKIVSSNFINEVYPIYTRKVSQDEFLKLPQYMNISQEGKITGLWSISEHYESLTEQQFSFLQAQFTLHINDRVCHLDPSSEYIDVYYPSTDKSKSIKIQGAKLDNKVSDNVSNYYTSIETESDYWYDFMYNPYLDVYILFQHIGSPYFDENENIAERKDTDPWAKIIVLDSEFQYVNSKTFSYEDEFLTIINPKFPTKDGYITIEIINNFTDSLGTKYVIKMQKTILDEI